MKHLPLLLLLISITGCSALDKVQSGLDVYQTAKNMLAEKPSHHTVIVAGYGTKVETNPTYKKYIQGVADYVSNTGNAVDSVVFSGTYSDSVDVSEAEAMNKYFNSLVDTDELQTGGVKVYKEQCAVVSWQNIAYSQELLATEGIIPTQVTLFGDQDREDKLKTFAIYKFNLGEGLPGNLTELVNKSLNTASVDYQGFDFGDSADTAEVRREKFGAEILGAYDTSIGNKIIATRLTEWSTDFNYDVAPNLVKHGCSQYSGF